MATNFTPTHISSPQLLEHVDPPVLFALLEKYQDFFHGEKVMPESAAAIDYERLSIVLAAPSEAMPAPLMADLFFWDEVAEIGKTEDLNEIAERRGIDFNEDVSIEEATLLVRMHAPKDLEDLYDTYQAQRLLRRKKRFRSYFATVAELPKWTKPSQRTCDRLASDMDAWYESQKKGRGTRVTAIDHEGAAWFIVRHGATFKRENAIEHGEPKLVFYRPEAYDLLIYYPGLGELAIYNESDGKRERKAYCKYLGKRLFGNPAFFEHQDAPKHSLEPLRKRWRRSMDCSDIPGLQSARLTYLRYQFNGDNGHCITHKAEDVFTGLEELDEEIPEGAMLVAMEAKLTPDSEIGRERKVKLQWPNLSVYDHERDAALAHQFLATKGFLIPRDGNGKPDA